MCAGRAPHALGPVHAPCRVAPASEIIQRQIWRQQTGTSTEESKTHSAINTHNQVGVTKTRLSARKVVTLCQANCQVPGALPGGWSEVRPDAAFPPAIPATHLVACCCCLSKSFSRSCSALRISPARSAARCGRFSSGHSSPKCLVEPQL